DRSLEGQAWRASVRRSSAVSRQFAQLLVVPRSWDQRRQQVELRRRPRRRESSPQHTDRIQRRAQLPLRLEGKIRNIESDIKASLENPQVMGADISDIAERLGTDPGLRREFTTAYGGGPDAKNVVDALASFQRTLITPGSRFDRWLMGDAGALSAQEQDGYRLFKSLGCVSCHQGVNIGGNLFQRHGIFHPLGSPKPEVLRVPSLRNVAATAPYFHDGSAATLDDAVRKMGVAQLNSTLTDEQVKAVVAYLGTLTGKYRGAQVGAAP